MNAPILFMPVGQDRAVAELAAAILEDGASASVVASEGAGKTAVLDRLASELAGGQVRIVRVVCPATGGLSLPAFLSQVVGRAKQGVLSDEDLELASDILTQADPSCSQIALLVDDAHDLLPPALRYIQLACRSGPLLRVVLAGRPGTLELLRGDEFAYLRQRISRNIQLPPVSATYTDAPLLRDELLRDEASVMRSPVAAAPVPTRRRNGSAWALAGLGVAATVALGLWLNQQDEPSPPLAASVAPEGEPALARLADPVETPPSAALAEAPPATPAPTMAETAASTAPAEVTPPVLAEAEPIHAIEPATPREAAVLLPQPLPEARSTLVEVSPPAPERTAVDAPPAPEHLAAVAESDPAAEMATPREAAALLPRPLPESQAMVVELPVAPSASEQAAADVMPEPPAASAAVTIAPLDPEPAVADAAPAAEPSAAIAEIPAAPPATEPPAVAAGLSPTSAPEPAVTGVAPAPLRPEAAAPAVASLPEPGAPSDTSPGAAETEPAAAGLPIPPVPVPAPALAVIAMPEVPRRVLRPARAAPERVAAYDTRTDERRCRDIVLRAQLGEDITNADRQFLRAGCRAGR